MSIRFQNTGSPSLGTGADRTHVLQGGLQPHPASGSLQANRVAELHRRHHGSGRSGRPPAPSRPQVVPLEEGLRSPSRARAPPGEGEAPGSSLTSSAPGMSLRVGLARPRRGARGRPRRGSPPRASAPAPPRARRGSRTASSARPHAARRRPPADGVALHALPDRALDDAPEARLDRRLAVDAHEAVDAVALEPVRQLVPAARALVVGVRLRRGRRA